MRRSERRLSRGVLSAAILIAGVCGANAQGTPSPSGDAPSAGRITVVGHGAVRAPNDLATLTVAARARDGRASAAFSRAGAAARAILDAARRADIDALDVTTRAVSLSPIYERDGGRLAAVAAYEAQQRLQIVVRAVNAVGPLIDTLAAIDDAVVDAVRFEVADPRTARDEARIAAVRDAFRIAERIAAEAGVALGPPLSIAEGGAVAPPPGMARAAMDAMPVAPGGDVIGVSVTIVFAMSP